MARRILIAFLIYFSAALILASAAAIGLIWINNTPLTLESVHRMETVSTELAQAQTAIGSARLELERTLRLVDDAEKALSSLKDQTDEAKRLFDQFNRTLDDSILPGLQSTRGGIDQLRATLVDLRQTLGEINSIPLLNLDLPGDEFLASLIDSVDALNSQIAGMQALVRKAEVFTSDASYLLGGDMTETKQHLQQLLDTVIEYDGKLAAWQAETRLITRALPGWIDRASMGLTIFLLWFGFSQYGLLLHGLNLRRGGDPLAALHEPPASEAPGI